MVGQDLNRKIYYRILSVDNRQNESELSEPLELIKPDIVPPVPPVLLQLQPGQGSITVMYSPSPSTDVEQYRLERLRVGEYNWDAVPGFDHDHNTFDSTGNHYSFLDTGTVSLVDYRYRLIASDSSGNESISQVLTGRAWDDGVRGDISNGDISLITVPDYAANVININQGYNKPAVLLQWDYGTDPGIKDFVIYRRAAQGPLRECKTLLVREGEILNPTPFKDHSFYQSFLIRDYYFIDDGITRAGYYEYRIIARHYDGGYSQMSDIIYITIN